MTDSSQPFCYEKPRPAVTVDAVLFRVVDEQLEVLLIQRGREPFQGRWALPGGFVDEMEPLETAVRRELREETGIELRKLVQTGAYGDPGRDPRGHTISIAFAGVLHDSDEAIRSGDDASDVRWFPLDDLPDLAFDHRKIIDQSVARGIEALIQPPGPSAVK